MATPTIVWDIDWMKASTQYQRDRASAYPSFAQQFDTLYHGGYEVWKESIDSIKTQFPKPN